MNFIRKIKLKLFDHSEEKTIIGECEVHEDNLILSLQNTYQVINLRDLAYCMSDKGYTTFYLYSGKSFLASNPLKYFETQLPEYIFFRTHQSYYVNINFVDKYDKRGFLILTNGKKIPVSTRKRDAFIARLLNL